MAQLQVTKDFQTFVNVEKCRAGEDVLIIHEPSNNVLHQKYEHISRNGLNRTLWMAGILNHIRAWSMPKRKMNRKRRNIKESNKDVKPHIQTCHLR